MITFAAIVPHPPNIVSGIGSFKDLRKAEATILAMQKLTRELEQTHPDVIVIISPHAPIKPYSFGVNKKHNLKGNLADFGLDKEFEFKNDTEMAARLIYACEMNNEIPVHAYKNDLDHGMMVPLYYLTQNLKPLILPLSFSALDLNVHYNFGELLGKICREEKKNVAIIASGDLSHRLTQDAPAGFSPVGAEFDQKLIKALTMNVVPNILDWKEKIVAEAGECGLRSIVMLLGALKGTKYEFKEYSYEGPLGVGYLTARLL